VSVAVRAGVLYAVGEPIVVEELELDPPREGEVLVRLAASGVCHSDLHMALGIHRVPMPAVIGHEGAGIVEEVGPGVDHVRPGDHVLLTWLPYCGRCRKCLRGRPYLCENMAWSDAGTMMDGSVRLHRDGVPIFHNTTSSFAERSVVPAQTALRVDPDLPLTELALMGCAVMTGVGAALNTAAVRPGETVAVVGCGGVGLNVVQGAAIAGACRIVAVDIAPRKLELARALGATDTVEGGGESVAEEVQELTRGGVDHAFEALGRPETIALAAQLTGPGGQTVVVGMAPPDARVPVNALELTVGERAIRGSWYGSCRPTVDFPILLDLYRSGKLRLDLLVTPCTLDDVNDAFRAMESGEVARSVIVF
jgi:S-(hydroxymethyl)glutathione dehydrogenase / alcohol dehydrogenase